MNAVAGDPTWKLGYRQRAILAALPQGGRPVPTGYLCRAISCDPRTTCMALRGLRQRGLVVAVRRGWWCAC